MSILACARVGGNSAPTGALNGGVWHCAECGHQGGCDCDCCRYELPANAPRVQAERLDHLFRLHHAHLVSFLTRMCGSRSTAEDVAGETWEAACLALPTARSADEALFPWLVSIARRRMFRVYTQHSREVPVEQLGEQAAPETAPYQPAAALPPWLAEAVAQLPPRQRQVMLMAADGIPVAATADWIGRTPAAVKTARYLGASRMRSILAPQVEGRWTR